MAFRLGQNANNNACQKATDTLTATVDAGTTNPSGRLLIYAGAQPATPQAAAGGPLLAILDFAHPAFDPADVHGLAGLAGGTPLAATIAATGTAGFFRAVDRDENPVFDGLVTEPGADPVGEMTFASTAFQANMIVNIDTFAISST